MKVVRRVCIKNYVVEAQNGDRQEVVRGREYITTTDPDEYGNVVVFSTFWVRMPVDFFAGPEPL